MSAQALAQQRDRLARIRLAHGGSTPDRTPPDWIAYRASLVNVLRREKRGETIRECEHCECEMDVVRVSHSPKCPVMT